MSSFISDLTKVLIHDEGIRETPYKDTAGFWTIGVGHFIGNDITQLKLSKNAINAQLQDDIVAHINFVQNIFGVDFYHSLDPARRAALVSLAFNLGVNLLKFVNTIELIKQKKWDEVCVNLAKSKWARDVDPKQRVGEGRDDRIINMFKTGKFPQEYKIEV